METIECRDCGRAVSFSARACPHCGSSEPAGSYQPSERERRLFRREARNDDNLAIAVMAGAAAGILYGLAHSSGMAVIFIPAICAIMGAAAGALAAVALNLFVTLRGALSGREPRDRLGR